MRGIFSLPSAFVAFVLIIAGIIFFNAYFFTKAVTALGLSGFGILVVLLAYVIGYLWNIPIYEHNLPQGSEIIIEMSSQKDKNGRTFVSSTQSDKQKIYFNFGGVLVPILLSAYIINKFGFWFGLIPAFLVVSLVAFKTSKNVINGYKSSCFWAIIVAILSSWIFTKDVFFSQTAYIAGSLGFIFGGMILPLFLKEPKIRTARIVIGDSVNFLAIFSVGIISSLLA